jgi:hypothetical protein
MSRVRQVGSLLVMAGFLALTTATSKPKSNLDAGTVEAGAPPSSSASASAQPILPADVDSNALYATLGCDAKPGNVGCKLLKDFDAADPWAGPPVPETVWFGETNAIGGIADGKKEFLYVQISGSPLGLSGGAHVLLPDNPREAQDALKLLNATRLGSTVPGSEALKFMLTPSGGRRTITKTRGKSQTFSETPPQVFIRARGERLLVVEHTGNFIAHESKKGPGSALAWVAELNLLR